jgi:transposase
MRSLRAGDRSLCQVAKDLDLSETPLCGWASQVDVGAGKGAPEALTTAERDELTR